MRVLRTVRGAAGLAAFACTVGLLAPGSAAAAGTYDVVFCDPLHRGFGGTIDATGSFLARSFCSDPLANSAVKIESTDRATEGRSAEVFWQVDDPLGITGVQVEGRLRKANSYRSELYMADAAGRLTHSVALGDSASDGFKTFEWDGKPQDRFEAILQCTQSPSCNQSDHARTWVRNVRLTVADAADPELTVEGSLLDEGWLRGEKDLAVRGADLGSGMLRMSVTVNDTEISADEPPCAGEISSQLASAFEPCLKFAELDIEPSTDEAPFVSGENQVRVCATDFAVNAKCIVRQIYVDNEAPVGRFDDLNPEDPELIRVPMADTHAGLASGSISYRAVGSSDWVPLLTHKVGSALEARVDSAVVPPGPYEFMAVATDVAGNSSETTLREDGTPMVLEFPLKSGVNLDARIEPGGSKRTTIPYGKDARIRGRLLDAAGYPLAGKAVVIDEDFGEGALIDHRVRTVITDESGRWSSKLPAGPTRSVTAEYEGDSRYLDSTVAAGRLTVRTGAKLGLTRKHVPEGQGTTFTGRIERLGARIPARGKLVQIQYQDPTSGRWSTVRNPFRTKSDGRFRFKYGFGTHYVQDVAIRFRLKVPSERGWPYRGTQTSARRVIVEARP